MPVLFDRHLPPGRERLHRRGLHRLGRLPALCRSLDEDYFDEPQPGFEPIVEAYHLWERAQNEGCTQAGVRAALASHADALALLKRLNFSRSGTAQSWLRRIPGIKCRQRAWDGRGMPGHNGIADYVFVDAACRRQTLPVLVTLCEALRGLVGEGEE